MYEKPEVSTLGYAVETVQSFTGKTSPGIDYNSNQANVSAYEADE